MLNLLSQSKVDEDKLSSSYINLLEMRNDSNVGCYNYDFHRELSNDNFDQIGGLINIIGPKLAQHSLFIRNHKNDKTYF